MSVPDELESHRCEECGAMLEPGVDLHELVDDDGYTHSYCGDHCPRCSAYVFDDEIGPLS